MIWIIPGIIRAWGGVSKQKTLGKWPFRESTRNHTLAGGAVRQAGRHGVGKNMGAGNGLNLGQLAWPGHLPTDAFLSRHKRSWCERGIFLADGSFCRPLPSDRGTGRCGGNGPVSRRPGLAVPEPNPWPGRGNRYPGANALYFLPQMLVLSASHHAS
jgi:hypothetical protein